MTKQLSSDEILLQVAMKIDTKPEFVGELIQYIIRYFEAQSIKSRELSSDNYLLSALLMQQIMKHKLPKLDAKIRQMIMHVIHADGEGHCNAFKDFIEYFKLKDEI